jgi:ERCC4-type nuclease
MLIPVASLENASQFINRLATQDAKPVKSASDVLHGLQDAVGSKGKTVFTPNTQMEKTVQCLPGIGQSKTEMLLRSFGGMYELCVARSTTFYSIIVLYRVMNVF